MSCSSQLFFNIVSAANRALWLRSFMTVTISNSFISILAFVIIKRLLDSVCLLLSCSCWLISFMLLCNSLSCALLCPAWASCSMSVIPSITSWNLATCLAIQWNLLSPCLLVTSVLPPRLRSNSTIFMCSAYNCIRGSSSCIPLLWLPWCVPFSQTCTLLPWWRLPFSSVEACFCWLTL